LKSIKLAAAIKLGLEAPVSSRFAQLEKLRNSSFSSFQVVPAFRA
jgi:hypothetical protein